METFSAASAIVAADAAAKCAQVELIELRLARGMCGKSYLMLTGSVASVTAAIERASQEASVHGMFLDSTVIPNPDKKLWDTIL
jgi:microcompartment protein CcmL/EutN